MQYLKAHKLSSHRRNFYFRFERRSTGLSKKRDKDSLAIQFQKDDNQDVNSNKKEKSKSTSNLSFSGASNLSSLKTKIETKYRFAMLFLTT